MRYVSVNTQLKGGNFRTLKLKLFSNEMMRSNTPCPILDNTGAEKLDFCKPSCPSHPSYHSLLLYWPGWALPLVLIGLYSLLISVLVGSEEIISDCIEKECLTNKVINLWNAVVLAFLYICCNSVCEHQHHLLDRMLEYKKMNVENYVCTINVRGD